MDSRQFQSVSPRCATKTTLRPVPTLIQSKVTSESKVSRTLIGGLRAYGGVGRLKPLKRRVFTDPFFPAISVSSPSVRNQDKTKTCSEVDSVQGNAQALGLAHFYRRLASIHWRRKAQVVEKQGFYGPMDSRPFQSVRSR